MRIVTGLNNKAKVDGTALEEWWGFTVIHVN